MRRQHDPFLKRLYRLGTRDALTLFFPDLAEKIDWGQWTWIDKEIPIVGRRPRSATADLVGETRDVDGRYMKVLVHPELQMQPDATMDKRAIEYNAGLMLQEGGPDTRVLTVVFYHCLGAGGIQKRRAVIDFYDTDLHTVTYWSVGLGELDAATHAERENPMGWALASWMRQQQAQRVELRLRLMDKILRFVRGDEYQELLLDAVQTYYRLDESEQRIEERLLAASPYEEVEEMAQTVMERQAARARREGKLEASRQMLKQAIETRFPEASESAMALVDQIGKVTMLERLLSQVIQATSLEEVERFLSDAIAG